MEKKVTELESDSLANNDLKSKLKQENTQLFHRYINTHQTSPGVAIAIFTTVI